MHQKQSNRHEDDVVSRRFADFFDLGKKVRDFANNCVDERKTWKPDESLQAHLYKVVCLLYFRSFKTLISILLLCKEGHGVDAMCLARTIFDNYLTLKYIQRDLQTNVNRFLNYPFLEDKFVLERALDPNCQFPPNIRKLYEERERVILEKYDMVKAFYVEQGTDEKKSLKKFRSGKWAGFSAKKMAEDLGMTADFEWVFIFPSCFVHPHAFGLSDFRKDTGSEVLYGARQSERWVFPALPIAIQYFLLTLKEFAAISGLDKGEEIESFLREVTRLVQDYVTKQ